MSYISRVGNLVKVPRLRESETGVYCHALVVVSDRERDQNKQWRDGPATTYKVSVSGDQARNLVAAAQDGGNIRVAFSGRYRVTQEEGKAGEAHRRHEVRADEIGVSLRGQRVTVHKAERSE